MTFKNIFDSGGSEAKSAEESAQKLSGNIPGAWPEWEGVDPELFEDIPEGSRDPKAVRDPKIVRETSPEALRVMNNFLTPLFQKTQTAATEQQEASEDPESTSGMASRTKDAAFKKVKVKIENDDQPKTSDERLEELKKNNYASVKNYKRPDDGSAKA